MGRISPNNKIIKVINPTSIIKFSQEGIESKLNKFPIEESKRTIEMFMKLFDTNKTASNLLGLFLKVEMRFKALLFDLAAFFISVLESEKKATSEPEISAELKINNKVNTILITKV